MFRTSSAHPQGDSCICSVVCFTYIGVSSLVEKSVCSRHCVHQTANTDARKTYHTAHTAHTTVPLRMNPTRFEKCSRKQKLKLYINFEVCALHWFVLYNVLPRLTF